MQLLREHPGRHFDPATLSAVPPFFRRVLRLPWRKPAAPASHPEAGAAMAGERYECCWHCRSGYPCDPRDSHRDPCEHGCNDVPDGVVHADGVLGTRTISEVRAEYDLLNPRGQHPYPDMPERPDGWITIDGSNRIHVQPSDPAACCPWPPSGKPAWDEPPAPQRTDETLTDLPVARPYVPQPVYGQTPVATVLEAELARRVTA